MSKRKRPPMSPPGRESSAPVAVNVSAQVLAAKSEPRASTAGDRSVSLTWTIGAGFLLAAFTWSYWPTFLSLLETWNKEPDYSHGYLVAPLAAWFVWMRRAEFPGIDHRYAWFGLIIIAAGACGRAFSAAVAFSLDGWSILAWVFGAAWVLFGHRVARWSLPAISFLLFMVPVPFSAERALSLPLQKVATKLSVMMLQFAGQPAIAEGNVILLGEHRLEVAQACSGLRIFIGVVALAFAYLLAVPRPWWQRTIVLLAVGPVAILANSTRIVATGLLYQHATSDLAQKFSHDFAGWAMIPLAAALFGLLLAYLDRVVRAESGTDESLLLTGRRPPTALPPDVPV